MTPAAGCLPADAVQPAPLDGESRSSHPNAAAGSGTPSMFAGARALRVCHVMSADLWAGAEVQVATTAAYLMARPDVIFERGAPERGTVGP